MSYAGALLSSGMRRIIVWQALIMLLTAGIIGLIHGYYSALSALYGTLVAIIITFLRGWRMQRFTIPSTMSPSWELAYIYFGALERFIGVVVGMGLGMGWLRLPPVPIIVGFSLAQLAYMRKMPDQSPAQSQRYI